MTLYQLPEASPLRFVWMETTTTTATTTTSTATPLSSMNVAAPEDVDFCTPLPRVDMNTLYSEGVLVENKDEQHEGEEEEEELPLVDLVGVSMITPPKTNTSEPQQQQQEEQETFSSFASSPCQREENSPAHNSLYPTEISPTSILRTATTNSNDTTTTTTTRRRRRHKQSVSNITIINNNKSITKAQVDDMVKPHAWIKALLPRKKSSTRVRGPANGPLTAPGPVTDPAATMMTTSLRSINNKSPSINDEDDALFLLLSSSSSSSVHYRSSTRKNNNRMDERAFRTTTTTTTAAEATSTERDETRQEDEGPPRTTSSEKEEDNDDELVTACRRRHHHHNNKTFQCGTMLMPKQQQQQQQRPPPSTAVTRAQLRQDQTRKNQLWEPVSPFAEFSTTTNQHQREGVDTTTQDTHKKRCYASLVEHQGPWSTKNKCPVNHLTRSTLSSTIEETAENHGNEVGNLLVLLSSSSSSTLPNKQDHRQCTQSSSSSSSLLLLLSVNKNKKPIFRRSHSETAVTTSLAFCPLPDTNAIGIQPMPTVSMQQGQHQEQRQEQIPPASASSSQQHLYLPYHHDPSTTTMDPLVCYHPFDQYYSFGPPVNAGRRGRRTPPARWNNTQQQYKSSHQYHADYQYPISSFLTTTNTTGPLGFPLPTPTNTAVPIVVLVKTTQKMDGNNEKVSATNDDQDDDMSQITLDDELIEPTVDGNIALDDQRQPKAMMGIPSCQDNNPHQLTTSVAVCGVQHEDPMTGTFLENSETIPNMITPHSAVAWMNQQQHGKQQVNLLSTDDHPQTIVYHDSLWVMTTTTLDDNDDHGNHPVQDLNNTSYNSNFPFVPSAAAEPYEADLMMWPSDEDMDLPCHVHEGFDTTTNEQQLQSALLQAFPTVQTSRPAPVSTVPTNRTCTSDSNACNNKNRGDVSGISMGRQGSGKSPLTWGKSVADLDLNSFWSMLDNNDYDAPATRPNDELMVPFHNDNNKNLDHNYKAMVDQVDLTCKPTQYLARDDGDDDDEEEDDIKSTNSRHLCDNQEQAFRDENNARDKPSFSSSTCSPTYSSASLPFAVTESTNRMSRSATDGSMSTEEIKAIHKKDDARTLASFERGGEPTVVSLN